MILLPAVDIRDGRAVRLRRGDFHDETVYADDPLEAARSFADAGASSLHVVDLDGARDGAPANLHHVRRMVDLLGVKVQVGGGLRDLHAVRSAFEAGARCVILGTAAYRDQDFLRAALEVAAGEVAVAVDVRDGEVSAAGWTESAGMGPQEVIRRMQEVGVTRFVYTDVERDGMLAGPDLEAVERVADAVEGRFLYSGGIGSLDDLAALRGLDLPNLEGVISGKALYEGRFGVAEAVGALD
jgi:phosphoribosylformimino-5-aminoimidazole carboxamide ribotide isomerase